MVFKGFDLKYPEYEVVTPQTNLSFTVRTLNVQEEERLKGSLVTPQKVTEHLNKCLYEAIVKKPASIKDFKSFLKLCTLKDRDALLYGLYHITYEDIRNYDITCASCRKDYPVTIKASDTFNFNSYPLKDIIKKRVDVPLPISKGITAVIKQPTLLDELNGTKALGSRPGSSTELITETLVVDKFLQDVEEQKDPITYDLRTDILDAYMTLPAKDKRDIHEKYQENFGKYGVDLKMRSFCTHCGHEEVADIDLVSQFFRMVFTS